MFTDRLSGRLKAQIGGEESDVNNTLAEMEMWKRGSIEMRNKRLVVSNYPCNISCNKACISIGNVVVPSDLQEQPYLDIPISRCKSVASSVIGKLDLKGKTSVRCTYVETDDKCTFRVYLRGIVFPIICVRARLDMSDVSSAWRAAIFAGVLSKSVGLKLSPIPVTSKVDSCA